MCARSSIKLDVAAGLSRQVFKRAATSDVAVPARELLIDGLGVCEQFLMLGHGRITRTVAIVGDADLDGIERRENIELGQGQVGQAIHARREVGDGTVEPTAATTATGSDTVLVAQLGELVAALVRIVIELGRHGAGTHASDICLHNADHAVNVLHAHAGAGDSAARGAIGRGDKGIGAVIDIQKSSLGALEEQRLAFVDHVVEQKAGLADVGTQALGVRQILLANLVDRVGGQVIDELQLGIDAS